jgi:murein DD-endopeptidase MepM/ murein hydrolase activator NlpD
MISSAARIVAALSCAVFVVTPLLAHAGGTRPRKTPLIRRPRPDAWLAGTRGVIEEHVHVRRGDSLGKLLVARGVGHAEAVRWLAATDGVYDLRRIRPRRGVSLRFDRATRALEAIRYEIDDRVLLVLEKLDDGTIRARRAELPYFTEVKGIATSIARGLKEDAAESGIPAPVVSELADIFGWELDVENDLHPGDEIRVIYENIWQTGAAWAEPGKVLGAEIVTAGHPVTAVFFEDADGRGAYYRPNGDPLSRDLLRYPLEFTEITSEFSLLRRHPILHVRRPHLGVDFAAPVGTPVRAVADGTVSYAGWASQLGRCVKIDHPNALSSTYGHLVRLAPEIASGAPVERGQVIGYVGATGLATGPHLHFAMHRDGAYVDPLALTAETDAPLADPDRRVFDRVQLAVTRQLAALPRSVSPLTVSTSEFDRGGPIRTVRPE